MRGDPYGTRRYLREYLLLHYGRPRDVCPFSFVPAEWLRFHERLGKEYLLPIPARDQTQGLDVGCAVGRFTFELGRHLDRVLGLDRSALFIQAARQMARNHAVDVRIQETGAKFRMRRLVLPKVLQQGRVQFQVGDALDLTAFPDQSFQVLSAINLIDRIPRPRGFLGQLARLLAPGGQLLIASPLTWLKEYTPSREWLTSSQVKALLRSEFRLAKHGHLPFLIREHRRKFQLVVAEVFTLIRRA